MKKLGGVAQAIAGLVMLAALVFVLVIAFRSVSGRTGAAPPPTAGSVTGYPAPAQTQSGYQAPGATQVASPYPTPPDVPTVAPTPALPPLNDAPDQFDPKTYGLPDTIAGYNALGVLTSENTACRPAGRKTLVLQSIEPTLQDALKNDRTADVMKALSALGLNTDEWDTSVAGPNSTREQLIADVQAENKEMETYGCVSTGGPAIPAVTSTSQNP